MFIKTNAIRTNVTRRSVLRTNKNKCHRKVCNRFSFNHFLNYNSEPVKATIEKVKKVFFDKKINKFWLPNQLKLLESLKMWKHSLFNFHFLLKIAKTAKKNFHNFFFRRKFKFLKRGCWCRLKKKLWRERCSQQCWI